ncbi:MAG: hypothetical protein IPK87_13685 [Planctomycetes bacterium]|nr:hypothetical protein [Planctomycetota bacterium]
MFSERRRQATLGEQQERLATIVEAVESEIQQGKPASDYYRDRVPGVNGWRHIALLNDAVLERTRLMDGLDYDNPRVAEIDKLLNAGEGLSDWLTSHWEPTKEHPDADPPIAEWLEVTAPLADGYALAASSDVVAVVPPAGDDGLPVDHTVNLLDRFTTIKAALGRCHALIELNRNAQAETELVACLKVWSRYRYPFNVVDMMVGLGSCKLIYKHAREWFEQGRILLC